LFTEAVAAGEKKKVEKGGRHPPRRASCSRGKLYIYCAGKKKEKKGGKNRHQQRMRL